MIKVYGMPSCSDCQAVLPEIKRRSGEMKFIDIGSDVRHMKDFIMLRDKDVAFDPVKLRGEIGIPCFVFEDGEVCLDPRSVGIGDLEGMEPGVRESVQGDGTYRDNDMDGGILNGAKEVMWNVKEAITDTFTDTGEQLTETGEDNFHPGVNSDGGSEFGAGTPYEREKPASGFGTGSPTPPRSEVYSMQDAQDTALGC